VHGAQVDVDIAWRNKDKAPVHTICHARFRQYVRKCVVNIFIPLYIYVYIVFFLEDERVEMFGSRTQRPDCSLLQVHKVPTYFGTVPKVG
jgi:hypothetical protein